MCYIGRIVTLQNPEKCYKYATYKIGFCIYKNGVDVPQVILF